MSLPSRDKLEYDEGVSIDWQPLKSALWALLCFVFKLAVGICIACTMVILIVVLGSFGGLAKGGKAPSAQVK